MFGADGFVIEGYVACRCGQWMVNGSEGAWGLCEDCRKDRRNRVGAKIVQLNDGGVRIAPRKVRNPRAKVNHRSESGREARRRRDRAEKAAMRTLAKLHPDEFAALVDRELAQSMTEDADSA